MSILPILTAELPSTYLVKCVSKDAATTYQLITCQPDQLVERIHKPWVKAYQYRRVGVGEPTIRCGRSLKLFTPEQADAYSCGYAGNPQPSKDWVLNTLGQMGELDGVCDEDKRESRRMDALDAAAEYRRERGED